MLLLDAALEFVVARARAEPRRPVFVGLNAPQGAGKSTLVARLVPMLAANGLTAAAVSIDDFYRTHEEQRALAAAWPGNPYLEHRGYPGTHDVALGEATLRALAGLSDGGSLRLPRYDKSLHAGRGDRAPPERWAEVRGPLDAVIVEGWMLGFAPVPETALADPHLAPPNRFLADYERWHARLDAMIVLWPTHAENVVRWRVEAEDAMRARGFPALTRAQAEDYVRRFLPAYATWAPTLGDRARWPAARRLDVTIDERRAPVAAQSA